MIEFGTPRRHFGKCDSTNTAAWNWAQNLEDPAPSGALLTADFQTQGRGQRGHQWHAEAGQSALMSFVYRLSPSAEAGQLGLVTALAVAEAVATFGVAPKIKWPNDILLEGGKVGGILIEVAGGTAVLGIGINVSQEQFAGAERFAYPPTSLRLASGWEHSAEEVIKETGRSLALCEERWHQHGFSVILDRCRAWLALGAEVRQSAFSGELVGLTEQGAAVVRLPDGTFTEWTTVSG